MLKGFCFYIFVLLQDVLQLGHRVEPARFRDPDAARDHRRRNPDCGCSVVDRAELSGGGDRDWTEGRKKGQKEGERDEEMVWR